MYFSPPPWQSSCTAPWWRGRLGMSRADEEEGPFVCCFGRNVNGEAPPGAPLAGVPRPVRNVGAGLFHSFAVTGTGDLYVWGAGSGGQLGIKYEGSTIFGSGSTALTGEPTRVPLLVREDLTAEDEAAVADECVAVRVAGAAGGRNHTLALSRAGSVFTWGRAANGQLGHGVATAPGATRRITDADLREPKLVEAVGGAPALPRLVAVSAGEHFSAGLTHSGTVYTWGAAANGQLGRSAASGVAEPRALPRALFGAQTVSQIALGWRHALALTDDGALYSWGCGARGQLGRGATTDCASPARIEALSREHVHLIAAGRAHSLAHTRGGGLTFAWGENESSQCGLGTSGPPYAVRPTALPSLLDHSPLRSLAAGAAHSSFVSTAGRLLTCGEGAYGQLGVSPAHLASEWAVGRAVNAVDSGDGGGSGGGSGGAGVAAHCAVDGDGLAFTVPEPRVVPLASRALQAACGAWHTVLLLAPGAIEPPPSPPTRSSDAASHHALGVASGGGADSGGEHSSAMGAMSVHATGHAEAAETAEAPAAEAVGAAAVAGEIEVDIAQSPLGGG